MAIEYGPDQSSIKTFSTDSEVGVRKQGNGAAQNHIAGLKDANRHLVKQIELSRLQGAPVKVTPQAQSIEWGERPTWLPNPAPEPLCAEDKPLDFNGNRQNISQDDNRSPSLHTEGMQTSQMLGMTSQSREVEPADIERPRSALHTGDFFQHHSSGYISPPNSSTPSGSESSTIPCFRRTPWHAPVEPSSPRHSIESGSHSWSRPINNRARAPSLGSSLSSSFVFRPPTSPLVHAASNADLDFSASPSTSRQPHSPERSNRRRTLPPDSFYSFHTAASGLGAATNFSKPFLQLRRETSMPCQAHQPRRSLTSTSTNSFVSSCQTPTLPRYRRPSFSSDHSPIQHASMVGSFEESILRGRMSTAPSKPLDFVAQIGVLGRGDCKASLRCPAHVTVPFPAVFYNYPSIGNRSFSDDSPSPYVGTIDLEHSLKPMEPKRIRRRPVSPPPSVDALMKDLTAPENTHIGLAIDRKNRENHRKQSAFPKAPSGGCYRVPQQGQLQIVIKNPNKTAVKLYLVPYSLDGMPPGTKTFVRQRSFSAGPILEKALTGNPQAILPDPLQQKSILRYLIHLRFCCPSKGRYYLYDNIRVVFANRVPDGKESLRNEVQLPEPRYSCYRPGREISMISAGAKLAAEKASRRGSSGFGLTSGGFEAMDGWTFTEPATLAVGSMAPASSGAIPFHPLLPLKAQARSQPPAANEERLRDAAAALGIATARPFPRAANTVAAMDHEMLEPREQRASPKPGFLPSTSARASPVSAATFGLTKYGPASRPLSPAECGEGLLAQELKGIDTQGSMDKPKGHP